MALRTARSLAPFAPHHAVAAGAFRDVLRRFHAWDIKECPQGLPFSLSTPGKRPGLVLTWGVSGDERAAARIPRPPLPYRWPLGAQMTQPLQLSMHPPTIARKTCVYTLCQPLRCADEVRQATLP
jgi:hypothetical protein